MKTKATRPVSGREMRERKERAARDVMRTLDDVSDPNRPVDAISRMSYKDLLGELIDDLKIRLEAAEQEDAEAEGR